MKRLASVCLVALSLGACDPASQVALVGVSVASLVHTDKTITDHVVSSIEDKDCSVLHVVDKEPYCQDKLGFEENLDANDRAEQARSYCYRTLGSISCYRQPDAMASGYARVQ